MISLELKYYLYVLNIFDDISNIDDGYDGSHSKPYKNGSCLRSSSIVHVRASTEDNEMPTIPLG